MGKKQGEKVGRKEEKVEGKLEGEKIGLKKGKIEIYRVMLQESEPIDKIIRFTGLSYQAGRGTKPVRLNSIKLSILQCAPRLYIPK